MQEYTFVSESMELRNLGFVVSALEDVKKNYNVCVVFKKKNNFAVLFVKPL